MSDGLKDRIERLENYILDPGAANKDSDHALLELAALHLQNPGLDPTSASWTGQKLQAKLDAFYGGKSEPAFNLNRGDPRRAHSRFGRDPRTGLTWPARILLEYANQAPRDKLKGEGGRFHRIAKLPGLHISPSLAQALYYEAKKSPTYRQEAENFLKKTRIFGKT